jgi:phosphoribosylanthranilate isomerase
MWIKICGITSQADAELAIDAGAHAIGLNLVVGSKRFIELADAERIARDVAGRVGVVCVVADLESLELQHIHQLTGARLQLHGHESPEKLRSVEAFSYKAVPVASAEDVERAEAFGGDRLLVDAKVPGKLGGTGQTFDWRLVTSLASRRQLVVAGGLTPDNVGQAIAQVQPFGVDVAGGVEGSEGPRKKDPERVRAFVNQAMKATQELR